MSERSMRNVNLAFRFVLELVVLVALFLWGVSVSDELIIQVVLGLGAPALAMTVWGLLVAPKASRRLPDPQRLAVEIVVFGAGVLAFLASGRLVLGLLLTAAATLSLFLMWSWGQRTDRA
jgi:hypothetical protein